jgi:hypothetical protein
MVELPNYKGAVIIGLFLSHGGLSYASDNNNYPRLGFEQAFSNFFLCMISLSCVLSLLL